MNDSQEMSCSKKCWIAAALGGLLVLILFMWIFGMGFFGALLWGIVLAVIGGLILNWRYCQDAQGTAGMGSSHAAGSSMGGSSSASTSSGTSGQTAAAAGAGVAAAAAASTSSASAAEAETEASTPAAASAAADSAATAEASSATSGSGSAKAAETPSGPIVKPSTSLAGQEELANRKGTWKYQGDDAGGDTGGAAASPASAPAAAAAPAAPDAAAQDADFSPDYDGDGVFEGKNEGAQPETLSGPRDGKADNLKEIKGIGPKLEKMCNSLGFYHFDQIANWSLDEVAWVDANLEGFKGRVTRDTWVEQAKILAAGGETAFSQKVGKGGVYD